MQRSPRFIPPGRTAMGQLLENPVDEEMRRQHERHGWRARLTYKFNPLNHRGFDHYFTGEQISYAIEDKNCSTHYQIPPSWLGPNIFHKRGDRDPTVLFLITCGTRFSPGAVQALENSDLHVIHFHYPETLRSEKDANDHRFRKWLRRVCAYIFDYLNPAPCSSIYYNDHNAIPITLFRHQRSSSQPQLLRLVTRCCHLRSAITALTMASLQYLRHLFKDTLLGIICFSGWVSIVSEVVKE